MTAILVAGRASAAQAQPASKLAMRVTSPSPTTDLGLIPAAEAMPVQPAPALTPRNVDAVIEHIAARRHVNARQVRLIRQAARTKGEKWNLPDPLRGEVSHALRGENLPAGFRVIDGAIWDAAGLPTEVISMKSHQLYAKGFRKPGALLARLKAEVDVLAKFVRDRRGNVEVRATPATQRVLEIEVPTDTLEPAVAGRPQGDPALRQQMRSEAAAAIDYARSQGVELRFKAVHP